MNGKVWFVFGALFLLVLCAYSNTFQSSWHLDDYPSVVNNSRLHPKDLSPDSLYKTFFSRSSPLHSLYRPVACLTFAANWYFGRENVFGYHVVNIAIHFLAAFILFFTVLNLYKSPNLNHTNKGDGYWIALLSAVLWALNPVQTQAVTYIVQRMASMAAMFYILGVYFYVKGRISSSRRRQVLYFMGCAAGYILAVGSKENAVTLPLVLFLAEIAFFQNLENPKTRRAIWVVTALVGLFFILTAAVLFIKADSLSIFKGYQQRSYTLTQRLMTEPRVIIFYVTQLFYPGPHRLSIEHDIDISTSFFEPWTTIPAILSVVVLIGIGLFQIKKRPIVAFSILFFFLNHVIESTILPLEVVFEHRNYLPSLFLFLPVAAGLFRLVDYYRKKKQFMYKILVSFLVLLVTGLSISTYVRNMAWATEKTLWEDAIKKAPGRARPAYNLAKHYYAKTGHLDMALRLYQKAFRLNASKPKYSRAVSLIGSASIFYMKQEYDNAIKFCQKALAVNPGFEIARFNMVLALAKLGRWDQASDHIDLLLAGRKNNKTYRYLKGVALLKMDKPSEALPNFRRAMKNTPDDRKTILNIGISLSLIKQYKQAEWFFHRAIQIAPDDIRPYFYLIETSLKAEDPLKTGQYLDKLFASFDVHTIISKLNGRFDDLFLIPPSRELMSPVVNDKLIEISDEIARLGA